MKKLLLAGIVLLLANYAFSDIPAFMVEANSGYAVGVNLDNAFQFDIRLYSPIFKTGVILEAGKIFRDNSLLHFFIAPMFLIINTEKWRVPIAVGFDLLGGKNNFYYGIGAMVAVHYSFAKNIYVGLNLGFSYAFNNYYEEIIGHKTVAYTYVDNNGQPQLGKRNEPVFENKDHYGRYIYIKPSIAMGFQY